MVVEGRLKTARDLRLRTVGVITADALTPVIDDLERAKAMLFDALEHPHPNSYGLAPEKVQEYLMEVLSEIDLLQVRLDQEEGASGVITNTPTHIVNPPFPASPIDYGNQVQRFIANTNLERLLLRSNLWNLPLHCEGPDPNRMQKISIGITTSTFHEAREMLKKMFWRIPAWRVDVAYLLYHYYCGLTEHTRDTSSFFREWLIQTLNEAQQPAYYPLLSEKDQDLELPFDPSTEALLINLLWLSVPRGDNLALAYLQSGILHTHYASQVTRVVRLLELEGTN
jgi:hypothetical protein